MKNKYLIILISFFAVAYSSVAQNTVYFSGLGRALVTSDRAGGSLYDSTSSGGNAIHNPNGQLKPDTASAKRGTAGYTIFDLGVNAQPNETLRASAIFRIKNEFGGFYGDGSFFYFRQLRLDGIINKVVKYEIGDIDLQLTPYTLHNNDESYNDYESDVFGLRRSVVNYENFNFGNKWRVQGAHVQTALKFNKVIEKINIRGFATRSRTTNYLSIPDRLFFGGRIDAIQSKYFQFGANLARMADLPQTSPSTQGTLYNNVVTGDYKLNLPIGENAGIELNGEFGKSYFTNDTLGLNTVKKGGFYDLGLAVKQNPLNIKLYANYRYVSADYLSPGAQTKRIYDMGYASYGGAGSLTNYNNLTQLYSTYNNGTTMRAPGLYDRLTQEGDRNLSLQPQLMAYLPQYGNITPYGVATPNRKGITIGLSAGESDKLIKADLIVDLLSEITGQGTSTNTNAGTSNSQLRKFVGVKGGASLNIAKLLKTERIITLSGGFRYEHTTRGASGDTASSMAPIDFKSTLVDLGLTVEVIKNFDIIAGYKSLFAQGNEVLAIRDASNNVVGYSTMGTYQPPSNAGAQASVYNLNPGFHVKQSIYAFGFRYRFTKNTYFTAQGNFVNYFDDSQKYADYKIKQLFLNYTMVF